MVVRVSSQKTASPFQKRNKRHFFYHKRFERFKVDLNTRTKAQNTRTKHSSEQRERELQGALFWLFKESHAESAHIFFHE